MADLVTLNIQNGIAIVSLNRPDKLNALSLEVLQGLVEKALQIKKDRSVRAVILTGEGKAFSAGLDVPSTAKNPINIWKLLRKPQGRTENLVQEVAICWRSIPVPVIAAINGACLGGGFQIALGADFRFVAPNSKFAVLEGKWGMIPDMGISVTIRDLVPIDVAKELSMSARMFDAKEALEMNLVSRICEDPMQEATDFATSLLDRSPDALVASKRLFNDTWHASEREALDVETRLQRKLIGSWNQLAASSRNLMKSPLPYIKRRRA